MTPITRETAQATARRPAEAVDLFEPPQFEAALERFARQLDKALAQLEKRHQTFCTTSSLRKAARPLR